MSPETPKNPNKSHVESELVELQVKKAEGTESTSYACIDDWSNMEAFLGSSYSILSSDVLHPGNMSPATTLDRILKSEASYDKAETEDDRQLSMRLLNGVLDRINESAINSGVHYEEDSGMTVLKLAHDSQGKKKMLIAHVGNGAIYKLTRTGEVTQILWGNDSTFGKDDEFKAQILFHDLTDEDRIFAVTPFVAQFLSGKRLKGGATVDPVAIIRQIVHEASKQSGGQGSVGATLMELHPPTKYESLSLQGLQRKWEDLFNEMNERKIMLIDARNNTMSSTALIQILRDEMIPHAEEILEEKEGFRKLRSIPRMTGQGDWRKRVRELLTEEVALKKKGR